MKKFTYILAILLTMGLTAGALTGCTQEDVDLVFDVAEALLAEPEMEEAAETDPVENSVVSPDLTPDAPPAGEPEPEKTQEPEKEPVENPPAVPEEVPSEEADVPAEEIDVPAEEAPQTAPQEVAYGEFYYDVENVVLYLDTYGELPENYITKSEARELGWEGGSVEHYQDGAAIGGDRFGNREGLLPAGSWIECDIDTEDENSRGAKRLVFNLEDGLYYFTDDHYESFVEVVVDENGEIVYKE